MVLLTVSDKDFDKLSRDRATLREKLAEWFEQNEGGHSTQKVVDTMQMSYGNCYNALKKMEKDGVLEAAYSGRIKIWRLKKE